MNTPTADSTGRSAELQFALCPRCFRAVPRHSGEHYCSNDGLRLLLACPACAAPIRSPVARYCTQCGANLTEPPAEAGAALDKGLRLPVG